MGLLPLSSTQWIMESEELGLGTPAMPILKVSTLPGLLGTKALLEPSALQSPSLCSTLCIFVTGVRDLCSR